MEQPNLSYAVLSQHTECNLAGDVDRYLNAGWRCAGGVALGFDQRRGTIVFAQAMIRAGNPPPLRKQGSAPRARKKR